MDGDTPSPQKSLSPSTTQNAEIVYRQASVRRLSLKPTLHKLKK